MIFSGYVPFTTLDYPDKIAFMILTAGCNLRCPYCHNFSSCVKSENLLEWEDIEPKLEEALFGAEAIVVSGGEPLIHEEVLDLLRLLKTYKKPLKLDTNGTSPALLTRAIKIGLSFVALDYKYPASKYGRWVDEFRKTLRVVRRLLSLDMVQYRTTAHKNFLPVKDLLKIVKELPEECNWKFQPANLVLGMLDPSCVEGPSYTEKELEKVFKLAEDKGIKVVKSQPINT